MNFSSIFHNSKYYYNGMEFISKDNAIVLLQQSGLSTEILGNIWHSCKQTQFADLTEQEFTSMMSMAQQHLNITSYNWNISQTKKKDYAKEILSIGTYQKCVRKFDVQSFIRTNFKQFPLQYFDIVYNMIDINQVENLTTDQFNVLRHVIDEYRQGIPIPNTIPLNILGSVSTIPVDMLTRSGSKEFNGSMRAEEYLNRIQTSSSVETSSEVLNSEPTGDLEVDLKNIKQSVLNKLSLPEELKSIEFDGKMTYLLLLNEMLEIHSSLTDPELEDFISKKENRIEELKKLIENEKLTML
eukprot:NODE_460_length_7198_cov_0.858290.p5 type:complete len:298 gc:universal NODE_460_length_7198_cov_0.858290:5101-5994(+)